MTLARSVVSKGIEATVAALYCRIADDPNYNIFDIEAADDTVLTSCGRYM